MPDSIGVYARVRPGADTAELQARQQTVLVRNLGFTLDWAFGVASTQEDVYDKIARERVARVLQGFNVCILAYGQTGSGKTHTMFGPDDVVTNLATSDATEHGLAPRSIQALFDSSGEAHEITCTYIEVYNDQINDLLGGQKALPLRETAHGPHIEGLASEHVTSLAQTMRAVARGNGLRVTAAMKMNARSSRGHALLSLTLQQSAGGVDSAGQLVLVDLAGMESAKKSYSVEGESSKPQRREEAKHINVSLFALGSVIERLTHAGGGHVPYRSAKLTRLLQPSLGGNCAPAIVVTLRAETQNIDECISTLRFAQRAKAVPVTVHANVAATPPDPVKLAAELQAASSELAAARILIERLQREKAEAGTAAAAAAAATPRGGEVATREAERREDDLSVARLQCEQLQGHMAELIEVTKEAEAAARSLVVVSSGGGGGGGGLASLPEAAGGGGWADDDLLEETRPGEVSLKAIEAELAAIEAAQAAPQDAEALRRVAQFQQLAQMQQAYEAQLQSVLDRANGVADAAGSVLETPRGGSAAGGSKEWDEAAAAAQREADEQSEAQIVDSIIAFGIDELRYVFPGTPASELRAVLERCGGDVNKAANMFAEGAVAPPEAVA